MPWEVARRLLGEAALTAGVHERTWKWWQSQDAVPAYRIVRVLKEKDDAAHDLPEASGETSDPKGDTMDARRLEELREMAARLFELNNQGNEVAQQHWTHLEHQVRTLLRDAEREG